MNMVVHWDTRTCGNATDNDSLDVLRWARTNGCSWDEDTCSGAAWHGKLEMLQWARANGCPWNEETVLKQHCHFEVLQWAHENGCPWDQWTCINAVQNNYWYVAMCGLKKRGHGRLKVFQWANENKVVRGMRKLVLRQKRIII
jgi:hypothetical protein